MCNDGDILLTRTLASPADRASGLFLRTPVAHLHRHTDADVGRADAGTQRGGAHDRTRVVVGLTPPSNAPAPRLSSSRDAPPTHRPAHRLVACDKQLYSQTRYANRHKCAVRGAEDAPYLLRAYKTGDRHLCFAQGRDFVTWQTSSPCLPPSMPPNMPPSSMYVPPMSSVRGAAARTDAALLQAGADRLQASTLPSSGWQLNHSSGVSVTSTA